MYDAISARVVRDAVQQGGQSGAKEAASVETHILLFLAAGVAGAINMLAG